MKKQLKVFAIIELAALMTMLAVLPAWAAPPLAPSGLELDGAATAAEVNLAWTDNADNETAIYVERKGPGETVFTAIANLPANRTSYADSGLMVGKTYIYRVWSWNSDGSSGYSNELTVVIAEESAASAPAAPTGLAVSGTPSFSEVNLVWTDNASNETTYYVDRQGPGESVFTTIATLEANAESYTDNTVSPDSSYQYRVWCWNSSRASDLSNVITVDVPPAIPPAAPTGLRLVAASSTRVELAWNDNGFDETAYIIERRAAADSAFTTSYTGAANLTSYSDSSVSPGAAYVYRVACSNPAGTSDYSDELTVTVPAIGTPPVFVSTVVSYYLNNSTFYVNGSARTMDVAPIASQERIFLPMRFVAEPLGGTALWDGFAGKATVEINGHLIELIIGSNSARVDGVKRMIDPENPAVVPLIVDPGRIMLPLRFIAESTGFKVDWLSDTSEARVTVAPAN